MNTIIKHAPGRRNSLIHLSLLLLTLAPFAIQADAKVYRKKNADYSKKISPIVCTKNKLKRERKTKCFKHDIKLQLFDSLGFPVAGTEFWVTLDVIKEGPKVTLQFPVVNFQTGQQSLETPESLLPPLVPGGYLYTVDGYLPECLRPSDVVNRSLLAASNNGATESFSFLQDPATLPTPPSGYIVQITSAGEVVVQCASTFGNIIPVGSQVMMPTEITYIVKPKRQLCNNVILSSGATKTIQFTNPGAFETGIRDSHPNDAYRGVAAWAWSDNSNIADKKNNTLNLMVSVGKVVDGKIVAGKPIQLTDLPANVMVADTAVAINRTDEKNIVVSYGLLDFNAGIATLCRAVSIDGGVNWALPGWQPYDGITTQPYNGPINIQPPFGWIDARGVASDTFGNIWYGLNESDVATFYLSTDKGVTYQPAYQTPPVSDPSTEFYDSPQYCFGGDGLGHYGLHFNAALFGSLDVNPVIGFVEIIDLGILGATSFTPLTQFTNSVAEADIAASMDGRVWLRGVPIPFATSSIQPGNIVFKSPGTIDRNYAGPWDFAIFYNRNLYSPFYGIPNTAISQPFSGYLPSEPTSIIYDESRKALYAIYPAPSPDKSQNTRIVFIISRDNGQTWSEPLDIASCNFANRGFQSMALDEITGDLFFGWYDGRNDSTYQSVEYFAAVIPANELDCLVNRIRFSSPQFSIDPGAPRLANVTLDPKRQAFVKDFMERKRAYKRMKSTII